MPPHKARYHRLSPRIHTHLRNAPRSHLYQPWPNNIACQTCQLSAAHFSHSTFIECLRKKYWQNQNVRPRRRHLPHRNDQPGPVLALPRWNPRREPPVQPEQPVQADRDLCRLLRFRPGTALLRAATPAAQDVRWAGFPA